MTYRIDDSQSPLYIVHYYDHLTFDQTRQLFAEVDLLLARPGKFGVLMNNQVDEDEELDEDFDGNIDDQDDAAVDRKHGHEPGLAKFQKAWLVANRDRFQQDCVGMAMVSGDSKWVSFYAPLANKIISRMYRCPGAIFGDRDKALAWVQARMPEAVAGQ